MAEGAARHGFRGRRFLRQGQPHAALLAVLATLRTASPAEEPVRARPGASPETDGLEAAPAILKAPPLEPGDTLALVAPAGGLSEALTRAAAQNIERRGYRVKLFEPPGGRRGYLAGTDEARAKAFNAAATDPAVKAILCLRGGYGSPRILDRIDYGALAASPKIIVGYSDITALLLAVTQRTGLITFHGPMGREWGLGRGLSPYSERYYWSLLATTDAESPALLDWGGRRTPGMKPPSALAGGQAEGLLAGGNLSVITALLGTPYELDARGAILFLEEVSEKPFRIDRMLNQLRLAGKLAQARGILLGAFVGCDAQDPEGDLPLDQVFADHLLPLGVPILQGFQAGHTGDHAALPMGARVRLDAAGGRLDILEACVAPTGAPRKAAGGPDPALPTPTPAPTPPGARESGGASGAR